MVLEVKDHNSFWYAKSKNYPNLVREDQFIREYLFKNLFDAGISNVVIRRKLDLVNINVYLAKPGVLFKDNNFEEFTKVFSQILLNKFGSSLGSINVIEVVNPDASAFLLADFMKQQLEKRIPFRRVMKSAILKAKQANVKGIKIQISGRLNGTEIARTEWIREGQVPLHTLRANIDYCSYKARTIFGILGIKVWLYSVII
uniref:ribosomal protein S3 n=1 Tax=Flexiglena variabilis TaxID=2743688 RepID=UPI0023AA6E39|nr:ribosomal protein S3 [Flexiglena variabilis]WCH63477.1 ribosomal protein S3 [Flexiglena variabilis]